MTETTKRRADEKHPDATKHPVATKYRVPELCCAEEERLIRKKLEPLEGVEGLEVNILRREVEVRHSCSTAAVSRAISELGFTPRLDGVDAAEGPHGPEGLDAAGTPGSRPRSAVGDTTLSGAVLLLLGLLLEYVSGPWDPHPEWLADILFVGAIVAAGWKIAIRGARSIRHLSPDMNFLMTVAAIGAVAIDKAAEGAAVMVLFSVAHLLEARSLAHARRSIASLMKRTPPVALVRADGAERERNVADIPVGSTIIVRPSESVAIDGVVTAGASTVDESMITGESVPLPKQIGARVYGGSINGTGLIEIRTTALHADSTVSRIIRMVEEAQSRRAGAQQFAERFARIYTPVVIGIAALVAVVPPLAGGDAAEWFYKALVLLVIACPCALVISTPVTIVSALAAAARRGILIKGGRFLEEIGRVRAFAFDKTGTLTLGKPHVTDLAPLEPATRADLLRTAAAIESKSDHHFASAIMEKAEAEGIHAPAESFDFVEMVPGRGIKGSAGSRRLVLGNHAFIEESGLCSPALEEILLKLEREGKSVIAVIENGRALGVIGIADRVREESAAVLRQLKRSGVERTIMLTGDNRVTAEAIAASMGVDEIHADLLPADKVAKVTELKARYGAAAMVGDGVNDAPALAGSSVGIAMGSSGSDVALETADVVLMGDELAKLVAARELGRKALRIIKQNVAVAFGVKLLFLILAMTGDASLWSAVLADDGATIVVIFNGLRVLRGS